MVATWKKKKVGGMKERGNLLLLQVVLTRTSRLAARERTFVVTFTSVNPRMAS